MSASEPVQTLSQPLHGSRQAVAVRLTSARRGYWSQLFTRLKKIDVLLTTPSSGQHACFRLTGGVQQEGAGADPVGAGAGGDARPDALR